MRRLAIPVVSVLWLVVLCVTSAEAQFARGSIYGTVSDANRGVVPGVTITLKGDALITPLTATTGQTGNYRFPGLPPGEYEVTAELQGFKTVVRQGIGLAGGSNLAVDMVLEIAQLAETVTISADPPLVDVTGNTLQVAYDERALEDIPTTRNIWSLMESMPGVVLRDSDVGGSLEERGNQVFAYGSQGAENTYDLNGVDITDPSGGAGGESYIPLDQDSFSEIRVETGVKSPEVRASGIYINMQTKSGGNSFSGGAGFFAQNDAMNSDNVSDELEARGVESSNEVLENNDYSARLGGPILRNRAWFFGAVRYVERKTAVLNFLLPDGTAGDYVVENTAYTGKVTTQFLTDNRFEFYYNRSERLAPYDGAGPNTNFDALIHEEIDNDVYQGTLTAVFGNRSLVDVRGGAFVADFRQLDGPFIGPNPVRVQELTTGRNSGAPGQVRHHWRKRYRFDVAMTGYFEKGLGTHEIRGGIQWEDSGQEVNLQVHDDHWLFFDDGVPARVRIWNSPSFYNSRYRDTAFHINDVWTISPRMTITAGVRFEAAEAYAPDQHNRIIKTDQFTLRPGRYFPEQVQFRADNILDWANPAARVGLTIDPFGDRRSAIRVSYGRYYAQLTSDFADVLNPNLARFTTVAWNDRNSDRQPQPNELDTLALLDFSSPTGSGLFGDRIDPNADQPLEDQVLVGYDRQVGQRVSLGLTYQYRRGERGLGYANEAVPFGAYVPMTIQDPVSSQPVELLNLPREFVGVTRRILTNQNEATRRYQGVEVKMQRRFADGWQLQGSVTVGKADGIGIDHHRSWWQDPNLLINRYGADPNDSTVLAKLAGSYQLPFAVVFGANYRYQSGRPFTPTLRVRGLNQGDVTINTEEPGKTRLDSQHLLDFRLEKRFNLPTGEVGLLLDAFNLLNGSPVLDQNALAGTLDLRTQVFSPSNTYRQVNTILPPRALRLGVRYTF